MKLNKRLLAESGPWRLYLALFAGFGAMGGALIILQAYFLSRVIDGVFLKDEKALFTLPLLLLLLAIIGRAVVAWANEKLAARMAASAKLNLREKLFGHLLALGPLHAKKERTGELANTTVEGVETLDPYFSLYLPQMFHAMMVPMLVLATVFWLDPLSGVVLAISAPVLPIFMILIGKQAEALNRKQWKTLSRMSAHFLDLLQGLTTLKLLGRSQSQEDNIRRVSERFGDITMKVLRVAFLSALVMEVGATISTAIVAVEVGMRLLYSQIEFQPAFLVLLLAPEFYLPMRSLGQRFHSSMASAEAAGRIFQVLDKPVPKTDWQQTLNHTIENVILEFNNVHFAYNNRPALAGVTFCLKPHSLTALVGPSGSGKSTLAQLLLRFCEPDEGQINLRYPDGEKLALSQIAPTEWRKHIGWVPQIPYLFNTTVAENIGLGKPTATRIEIIEAAKLAHAHEFIRNLPQGYDTPIGERGLRLSGGQAQRLSLARAFLKDAPLLVLDEVTSNLDAENEGLVLDAIERLVANRTVLFITHRAETIARADYVVELAEGRISKVYANAQALEVA